MTEEFLRWLVDVIRKNNVHAFYVSTPWKHKRVEILNRDKNECQHCKAKGEYSAANTVHHIKYLRSRPDLALDDDNLISLCDSCHWDVHHLICKELLNTEKW